MGFPHSPLAKKWEGKTHLYLGHRSHSGGPWRCYSSSPSWPHQLFRMVSAICSIPRDYYANLHAAFYREEDACRTLLENKDAIDWDKAFQLQGLQDGLYQAVKVMAEARSLIFQTWWDTLLLFHHHYHLLFPFRLRSDPFHLGTLNPSHAALLNDTYEFGGNDRSLHYLRSLIEDFPNACLLDHKGKLVAWSLSDALGCLTHGYALSEYRGKGHMKTVMQALARKLHAKDFALYARVLAENKISKQFLSGQGFHLLPWTKYILFLIPNHMK
uniref:Glycine N-acyltransferase-like protein n=1 Tax=Pseudonaja textilis TaxID=8673 RepID=A0A670YX25_PSETE